MTDTFTCLCSSFPSFALLCFPLLGLGRKPETRDRSPRFSTWLWTSTNVHAVPNSNSIPSSRSSSRCSGPAQSYCRITGPLHAKMTSHLRAALLPRGVGSLALSTSQFACTVSIDRSVCGVETRIRMYCTVCMYRTSSQANSIHPEPSETLIFLVQTLISDPQGLMISPGMEHVLCCIYTIQYMTCRDS